MLLLRRLDTHHKLYASFALLLCLSMGLALWLLGQLEHASALAVAADQKPGAAAFQVQAGYAGARLFAWVAIALTLAAAAMLALWLRAEMARPVHEAACMARRVAGGDLSTHIGLDAAGEAGELLDTMQQMNDNLAGMIVKVRGGTESIASSAGQIAAGSIALAAHTDEQVASLRDGIGPLSRLEAAAVHSTLLAQLAGKQALAVSDAAAQGADAMANMAAIVLSINHACRRVAGVSAVLDALAADAILLAQGAAGENGRGADAPDNGALARRLSHAAVELKLLADGALDRSSAAAMLTDQGMDRLRAVGAATGRMGGIACELTDAAAAQALCAGQAGAALAAMDQACRRNAVLVAQCTATATTMRDQAGSLSRATAAFVLGPEYGVRPPAIHLVSSNPQPTPTLRCTGGARRLTPVLADTGAVPARLVRSQGAAARRDLNWEEF